MRDASANFIGAAFLLAAVFAAGTGWGLFLNVTHMHRMRRWANKVCDRLDLT